MKKRLAEKIMKRVKNSSSPELHNYTSKQLVEAYSQTRKKIVWSCVIIPGNQYQRPQGKHKFPEK